MKPTTCRMCGEKFQPTGEEHVCGSCIAELNELELANPQPQPTEEKHHVED